MDRLGVNSAARLIGVFEDAIEDPGAMRRTLTEVLGVELSMDELDFYAELLRETWDEFRALAEKEAQRTARTPSIQCALEHLLRGRELATRPPPAMPVAPEAAPGFGQKRWRTTRATLRGVADNEDERAQAESSEQAKWITAALDVLADIGAPSLLDSSGVRREPKLLRHLFGKGERQRCGPAPATCGPGSGGS